MKQLIASVFDSQVGVYSQPQLFVNRGALSRAWEEVANDLQTPFGKYPAHFTMFVIGVWDDETGTVEMLQAKESMGTALEYQQRTQHNLSKMENKQ